MRRWGHTGAHLTAWRRDPYYSRGLRVTLKRYGWGVPLTWQTSDLFVNLMHLQPGEVPQVVS